jgi:hypothetical protein
MEERNLEEIPTVERNVLLLGPADKSVEREFWFSLSPLERLNAAEQMRRVTYSYENATGRIEKVISILDMS